MLNTSVECKHHLRSSSNLCVPMNGDQTARGCTDWKRPGEYKRVHMRNAEAVPRAANGRGRLWAPARRRRSLHNGKLTGERRLVGYSFQCLSTSVDCDDGSCQLIALFPNSLKLASAGCLLPLLRRLHEGRSPSYYSALRFTVHGSGFLRTLLCLEEYARPTGRH